MNDRKKLSGFAVVLAAAIMLCAGCHNDTTFYDRQFVPVGDWTDGYGDYSIIKIELDYDSGFGDSFKSDIITAVDFSETSGVIIVQLTEVTNATGDYPTYYTVGKYAGVYYKDYSSSHIFLANAIDETYALVQKDTLNQALSTFTAGNMGTYVTTWGSGYDKQ